MTSSEALPVTIDIVCFCLLCVLCLVLEGGKEDGIVKKPKEEKNKTPVRNTKFFFHVVRVGILVDKDDLINYQLLII